MSVRNYPRDRADLLGRIPNMPNLKAENIAENAEIFGIQGTAVMPDMEVQSGEISMQDSNQEDVSISTVDLDKSIIIMNVRAPGYGHEAGSVVAARFHDSSTIRFTCYAVDSDDYQIVRWFVVEFAGLHVQHISFQWPEDSSSTAEQSISAVNTDKAFIIAMFWGRDGTGKWERSATTVSFKDSSTLQLEKSTGWDGGTYVEISVVEVE